MRLDKSRVAVPFSVWYLMLCKNDTLLDSGKDITSKFMPKKFLNANTIRFRLHGDICDVRKPHISHLKKRI
ncbi:hypothetical protein PR048_011356 [Dryococelus australis]|uniref:Uncharacterized protein n=1 Tax=Dryococelus australis TaxID=614101 RepID=A0ABQ9HLV6_9NEOP|nr:hypothetical protein PR048_011356 [Dryococelus australis]